MKKILITINDLDVGGAQQLAIDEVLECRRQGYDVRLLTFKNEKPQSMMARLGDCKNIWTVIPFSSFYDITSWLKTYKYLKELKPEIVISQLWHANTVLKVLGTILKIPKVICFEQNVYDTIKSKKNFLIDEWTQNMCTKIVASSPAVKESLIRNGIKEERIVLIYNAVAIKKFEVERQEDLFDELGLPKGKKVFLIIARLVHQKAYDILLRAFSGLGEDCILVSAGWGELESELKKQAEDLKISDRVFFLGSYSNAPRLLSIADVFVLPSRHEGFSISLLEAMAAKKAIIISDFEAGRDVIRNGENGLVVKRENVEELTQAMKRLAEDSVLRERLAKAAREKVEDYSISKYIDAIINL